jgi:hypothetical protein
MNGVPAEAVLKMPWLATFAGRRGVITVAER